MAVHDPFAARKIAQDLELMERYFEIDDSAPPASHEPPVAQEKILDARGIERQYSVPTYMGPIEDSPTRPRNRGAALRRAASESLGVHPNLVVRSRRWIGATGTRRFGAEFAQKPPEATWKDFPPYRYMDPRISVNATRNIVVRQKAASPAVLKARRRAETAFSSAQSAQDESGSPTRGPPTVLVSSPVRRRLERGPMTPKTPTKTSTADSAGGSQVPMDWIAPSRFLLPDSASSNRFEDGRSTAPRNSASSAVVSSERVTLTPYSMAMASTPNTRSASHVSSPPFASGSRSSPLRSETSVSVSVRDTPLDRVRSRAWSEPGTPFAISEWESVLHNSPSRSSAVLTTVAEKSPWEGGLPLVGPSPSRSPPRDARRPGPPAPRVLDPYGAIVSTPSVTSVRATSHETLSRRPSNQHVSFSTSVTKEWTAQLL